MNRQRPFAPKSVRERIVISALRCFGSTRRHVASCAALLLWSTSALTSTSSEAQEFHPGAPTDDGPIQVAMIDPSGPRIDRDAVLRTSMLSGRVSAGRLPIDAVRVYAYQLADLTLKKATTDRLGEFNFKGLPAGLYKIIAHKPGFVPAVVLITRNTAETFQYIDLELAEDDGKSESGESGFWKIRSRIPSDVLRDIQLAEAQLQREIPPIVEPFETGISALRGVQDLSVGSAALTGGDLEFHTLLGDVELGIEGEFRRLEAASSALAGYKLGSINNVSLDIAHADTAVSLTGRRNSIDSAAFGESPVTGLDVGFEHYGVDWRQRFSRGESSFEARYVAQSNLYGTGETSARLGLPTESSVWTVQGSYERQMTDRNSLRTGLSYRQREAELGRSSLASSFSSVPSEQIDLFSIGEVDVLSSLMIQYGLFTTLRDGSVSFSPHAGLVVHPGTKWALEASARERLSHEPVEPYYQHVSPAYHGELAECGIAEDHCYRVAVSRALGDDGDEIRLASLHREFNETLRLYFSDDFFQQLDSLYLVPGDELPELQLTVTRRLSPNLLAKFESNVATGGGGIIASGGEAFENEIGYLVTSVEGTWEPTSTGVQLAFHRMEQRLNSLHNPGATEEALDLDRVQVLLTQHLGNLLGLASDWALSLDMQFTRGGIPYGLEGEDTETRKRFMGGIAVKW